MHENIRSFRKYYDEFNSFASELSCASDVIVLSETWFYANDYRDVRGDTAGFHTYRADKAGQTLCLLEIVTHRPIWQIFQCVMHIMRLVW